MSLIDIHNAFAAAHAQGRPAFMPYWMLGYPTLDVSLRVIEAIARGGADLIELGLPFSDPLADGPVNQRASQVALENGATVRGCIEVARRARANGVAVPMLPMGYMNPIVAFGVAGYVTAWHDAGADGLIVPDLPPEESAEMGSACAAHDMALVQFAAPTSTPNRLALAAKHATGFIYIVAVTGITGPRETLAIGLRENVERVKAAVRVERPADPTPVVVGFGISTREHVVEVGQFADGVIIASALIRAAGESPDPPQTAYDFVRAMRGL